PSHPDLSWEAVRDALQAQQDEASLEALEFMFPSPFAPAGNEFLKFVQPIFKPRRPLLDASGDLSHYIHETFKYEPKSTSIDTPLGNMLRGGKGVCQDFAHLMIAAMRSLRLPARYVSGYLRSGANFQGAEASHAWVSVYSPGNGWVSFDPTND